MAVLKNKTLTAADIHRSVIFNPNQVSLSTIHNLLKRLDLVARISPSKPAISTKNIDHRLLWAKDMLGWSEDEIRSIVFSDESKLFCQKQGKKFIRVLKGKRI